MRRKVHPVSSCDVAVTELGTGNALGCVSPLGQRETPARNETVRPAITSCPFQHLYSYQSHGIQNIRPTLAPPCDALYREILMPELTPIQSQVLADLLAGKSVSAAARENGIHRSVAGRSA